MTLPIRRFRIVGHSMEPELSNGAFVLVNVWAYRKKKPRVGDLVACRHPFLRERILLKRVAAVFEGGQYFVVGDHQSDSLDSRSFGAIGDDDIIGRVWLHS